MTASNKIAILVLIFCTLIPCAHAEESNLIRPGAEMRIRHMTLQQCFDAADKNNKEIQIASATMSVAQAGVVIARALPNPTFNSTYGWGPAWKYICGGNLQQFGLTEEILVAGKQSKEIGVAQAGLMRTALNIEEVRFAVHNRVRRAYIALAKARAVINTLKAQHVLANEIRNIVETHHKNNRASITEFKQANVIQLQLDLQLNEARGVLIQESARMEQLIGELPDAEDVIESEDNGLFNFDSLDDLISTELKHKLPELEQLLPIAWSQRKDLKVAIQQAYAQRKALTLAKAQRIPDPTVGFYYQFSTYGRTQGNYFDSGPTLMGTNNSSSGPSAPVADSGAEIASPTPAENLSSLISTTVKAQGPGRVPFQPGYMFTLDVEAPIFHQYQGQINQADATWKAQLRQNESKQLQIASDIIFAYESLQSARECILTYQRDLIPAARKLADLTKKGFELGNQELSAAILARQDYRETLNGYVDAVADFYTAWADMENAVGVPLNKS